jgi:hypothetical protein
VGGMGERAVYFCIEEAWAAGTEERRRVDVQGSVAEQCCRVCQRCAERSGWDRGPRVEEGY